MMFLQEKSYSSTKLTAGLQNRFEQTSEDNLEHTTHLHVKGLGVWTAVSSQKQQSKTDACEKLLKEGALLKKFLKDCYYRE